MANFYSADPIINGVSNVTATPGSNDPKIGTRVNYAGNEYVYVYNAGSTDAAVGKCVVPVTGGSSYSCTVSSTASNDLPLGVVKNAILSASCYGYVLSRGYGTAHTSAAITAGTALEIGADGILQTHLTGVCVARLLSTTSAATTTSGSAYFRF